MLGAWVSSEGGNCTEKLPSPRHPLASPTLFPSFLPGSSPLLPRPRYPPLYSELTEYQAAPPNIFLLSPAPITKNGVRVSGETKLSSQHLFQPLFLNWFGGRGGEGSPTPPTHTHKHHSTPPTCTPKPDFAFCILGAGQAIPGLNSLSTPRGWHTQVSERQLCIPVFPGRCGCKVCGGLLRSQTNF